MKKNVFVRDEVLPNLFIDRLKSARHYRLEIFAEKNKEPEYAEILKIGTKVSTLLMVYPRDYYTWRVRAVNY